MITPSNNLNRRIVSRYLSSQRNRQNHQSFFWNLPVPKPHVPDDIVLQCSRGCTLTSREIEQMLPIKLRIELGSCRIKPVNADGETNKTRFEAATTDGRRVTGTITVNIVASERRLDAPSIVDLDT